MKRSFWALGNCDGCFLKCSDINATKRLKVSFFQGLTQIRPRALIRKDFVPGSSNLNYTKIKLFQFLLGISRPHFEKLLDFSLGSLVKSNQAILPSSSLSSKYGHFWAEKVKMPTVLMPNSRLQNSSPQISGWCHSALHLLGTSRVRLWLIVQHRSWLLITARNNSVMKPFFRQGGGLKTSSGDSHKSKTLGLW